MTIYRWGNPRYVPELPPPIIRYVDVDVRDVFGQTPGPASGERLEPR